MKLARVGAVIAVAAIVVSACSGSSTPAPSAAAGASAGASAAGASAAAGTTEVKIGIELPLSGGEKPNGEPTLNGVKLALAQHLQRHLPPRWGPRSSFRCTRKPRWPRRR